MRLTVDGMEIEVSEEVGAVLKAMIVRSGGRVDDLTQADVARARFDAETLAAHRWGALGEATVLPLNEDGEVHLEAARKRFDAATLSAHRWGTLAAS